MTAQNEKSLPAQDLPTRLLSVLPAFFGALADALILITFVYFGRVIIGPSPVSNGAGALVGLAAALIGMTLAGRRLRAGGMRTVGRVVLYARLMLATIAVGTLLILKPLEFFTSEYSNDWYTPLALLIVFGLPSGVMGVFYRGLFLADSTRPARWAAVGLGAAVGAGLAFFVLWPIYGAGFLWFIAGGVSLFTVLTALPDVVRAAAHTSAGSSKPAWLRRAVFLLAGLVTVGAGLSMVVGWGEVVVQDEATGYRSRYVGRELVFSGTELATDTETIVGHLGPLLHPWPRHGLVVAPRSEQVVQAAVVHPYLKLDVFVESASSWNALVDDRVAVTSGGSRAALRRSRQKYDVVTVGGGAPKTSNGLPYYTAEFYLTVKKRLKSGGSVIQGIDLRGLSEPDVQRIVGTFGAVFSDVHIFAVPGRDLLGEGVGLILYGSDYPLSIDYQELDLRSREPRIAAAIVSARMSSADDLLDLYVADDVAVRRWTAGTERLTDLFARRWSVRSARGARPFESASLLAVRTSILNRVEGLPDDPSEIVNRRHLGYEAFGLALAGRYERALDVLSSSPRLQRAVQLLPSIGEYYASVAEKNADDAAVLFDCASALGNQGFGQEGLELFERALALKPSNLSYAVNTALAMADVGDVERALELLEKHAADDNEDWLLHYNLGSLKIRAGDPGGALADLQRAMALNPRHEGLLLAFADANLQLGRLPLAERAAQQIVALNQFNPEAWDLLGLISQAEGDFPRARRRHRRALVLNPYRPSTHYNMGVVLQSEGRILEAAAAYRAALFIEPKDAEAENNLGLLYAGAGLFERAADAHKKALEVEPNYPEAAYNLGLAYLGLGQSLAAAEAFGLALKLAPDLEAARDRLGEMGIDAVEIETEGATTTE